MTTFTFTTPSGVTVEATKQHQGDPWQVNHDYGGFKLYGTQPEVRKLALETIEEIESSAEAQQ